MSQYVFIDIDMNYYFSGSAPRLSNISQNFLLYDLCHAFSRRKIKKVKKG